MDKVDEMYLTEVLKGTESEEGPPKSKYDVAPTACDKTYDEVQDMVKDTNRGDMDADLKLTSEFIKLLLHLWGKELNERSEDVKMSVKGKIESGTYTQTK